MVAALKGTRFESYITGDVIPDQEDWLNLGVSSISTSTFTAKPRLQKIDWMVLGLMIILLISGLIGSQWVHPVFWEMAVSGIWLMMVFSVIHILRSQQKLLTQ